MGNKKADSGSGLRPQASIRRDPESIILEHVLVHGRFRKYNEKKRETIVVRLTHRL